MRKFSLYIMALLALAGCNKKTEVQTDQVFVLKYKQTATLGGLEIKFNELSDSRCANDVECIIPGELEIGLKINKEDFDLILESINHSKVVKDGFEIELVSAAPVSFSSTERPRKKDYTVQLIVSKAQQ